MNNKLEHLKLIQNIIARMSNNSFYLKGWTITLVSAFIALAVSSKNLKYIIGGIIPLVVFWILDGFFVRQENLYRKLYDNIRMKKDDEIDFSMDVKSFEENVKSWGLICFSKTLSIFYMGILIAILIILYFLK